MEIYYDDTQYRTVCHHNILYDYQYGFREKHSVIYALLEAVAARDYFKQVGYMIRKAGQNKYSL